MRNPNALIRGHHLSFRFLIYSNKQTELCLARRSLLNQIPSSPFPLRSHYGTFTKPRKNFPTWARYTLLAVTGGSIVYGLDASQRSRQQNVEDPSSSTTSSLEFMPEPSTRKSSSKASLPEKILGFLRKKIFSPLRTGLRFLHLVFIFSPVMLACPMLFIGTPEGRHGGERWGAIWWYDLLTQSMQRAGPTFIKVNYPVISFIIQNI